MNQVVVLRHQLAAATALGDHVAAVLLALRLKRASRAVPAPPEPWSELELRYRFGDR